MKLTREDILRMVGDRGGSSQGGGGNAELSGIASMAWVNETFLGIEYFNQLFETTVRVVVTDTSTTPATILSNTTRVLAPNEVAVPSATTTDPDTGHTIVTTMALAGIQVKTGLWSNSYVSALGQNSGGGGGGGSLNEPLASINTASLGTPTQAGQVITWNGSAWVYDIPSGGGGSSTLYGLVDVNISNPTNGQALVYNATSQKWQNQTIGGGGGGGGTLTSIGLIMPTGFDVSPSTLMTDGDFTVSFATGYGLPLTADVQKGVTAYGWGNHANAGYLTESDFNAFEFWGQTISNGVVQGSIDAGANGGAITGFHSIELNTEGSLSGYGGFIDFHYNGALSDYTARIIESYPGTIRIYDKLQIGDAVIEWDSNNQCLKINGNLLATGGVTALG